MPGFNGTGPQGMGPRTGGGRGFCTPGTANNYNTGTYFGIGRGGAPWGGGRGRGGYGHGHGPARFYAPYGAYVPDAGLGARQEVVLLKNQAAAMAQELDQIRRRIDDLSAQKTQTE